MEQKGDNNLWKKAFEEERGNGVIQIIEEWQQRETMASVVETQVIVDTRMFCRQRRRVRAIFRLMCFGDSTQISPDP